LGRSNDDLVPGGLGRPDDMPQLFFDIASTEAELVGDGRNGPRLNGQMCQKVLAERHVRVYAKRLEMGFAEICWSAYLLVATAEMR
jgi:hypothetical protein